MTKTKKIICWLLSLMMVLILLPMNAFASDTTVTVTVELGGLSVIMTPNVNYRIDPAGNSLTLEPAYDYIFEGNALELSLIIYDNATVLGGEFNRAVTNRGIIKGGTFSERVTNDGTITDGTFNEKVINYGNFNEDTLVGGIIDGGTFNAGILNYDGVAASGMKYANVGELGFDIQNLGTGSIAVKQNSVDIPKNSGKAGEVYNIANFDPDTLAGLYMLREGEELPTEDFSIDEDIFTPVFVFGMLTQYEFTMPDEAITIVAVFSDYEYYEPIEIGAYPIIMEGTSPEQLENGEILMDYNLPRLTNFSEEITLTGDSFNKTITVDDKLYEFAGFLSYSYDEATETGSYKLEDTYTIAPEPAERESDEWYEWYSPISDGIYVAYVLCAGSVKLIPVLGDGEAKIEAVVAYDAGHANIEFVRLADDAATDIGNPDEIVIDLGSIPCESLEVKISEEIRNELTGTTDADLVIATAVADVSIAQGDMDSQDGAIEVKAAATEDIFSAKVYVGDAVLIDDSVKLPEGIVRSDDMKLADGINKAVAEPIADLIGAEIRREYVLIDNEDITTKEQTTATHKGIEYSTYEFVVIDDVKYLIVGIDFDGEMYLIKTDDSSYCSFRNGKLSTGESVFPYKEITGKLTINGVTYDVVGATNTTGISEQEFDDNPYTYQILHFEGKPAGIYFPNSGTAEFYEDYAPASIKAQPYGKKYVGAVVVADNSVQDITREQLVAYIDETKGAIDDLSVSDPEFIKHSIELDNTLNKAKADLAQYDMKEQLTPGKTYKVVEMVSRDISLEGWNEALCVSVAGDSPEMAAAKEEIDLLKDDMEAKQEAWEEVRDDSGHPDHMLKFAEWNEANDLYNRAIAVYAGHKTATVAESFQIPAEYADNPKVKFVAVHDTNPFAGAFAAAEKNLFNEPSPESAEKHSQIKALYDGWEVEHGTGIQVGDMEISADGLTATVSHSAYSFSPFVVYALIEAEEPEIKEIETQTSRPSSGGGGVSRYTIKFNTDGGTAIANKTVSRNSKLAEPDAPTKEGYTFNGWFTDEELTEKYDFDKAVTKSLTLYAKWEKEAIVVGDWINPFEDVSENDWFFEDVEYVNNNVLMQGTSSTTFAPNTNITRAMMITILWRMEAEPVVNYLMTFEDVAAESWYTEAVRWAASEGIVSGYSETSFAPNDNITREQIAAIIHRYAKYKEYDVSVGENTNILSYDDFADISEYAISAMQYTSGAGLMKGKSESTLNPKANATRAELAAILHRFIEGNK